MKGAFEIVDFGADVDAAGERFEKALCRIERGESGKGAESEIDFGDRAIRAEIFDAIGEGRIELRRIDEVEESALGVDSGNDGFDGDFFAAGEHDSRNGAVFKADVPDFRIGGNLRLGLLRRFGQGRSEVAEPAPRKSSGPHGMCIAGRAHKKDGGGTRGPRTERGAENAACGDDGTDELRLEKFGNEVRNGHGAPAKKVEDSLLAEHADIAAGLKEIPEIFRSGLVDPRRRDRNELVEDSREMIESIREFNVFDGILGGNARNAASGLGVIVPEEKRVAIGCGGEYARAGIEYFALEFFNLHVARDLCAKRAEGMGERGGFEAGIKFLGDGAATDHFAAFEDEWLENTLGAIEGGHKSILEAADENYTLAQRDYGQTPSE